MRVTQRSPLWARCGVLYALLLLGLVLMHHAPQDGGHGAGHGGGSHAAHHQPVTAHPADGARAAGVVAAPAAPPEGDAGAVTHLCLAVVVAVTTLGVALALAGPAPSVAGLFAARAATGAPRPRAPVPRMLASLGVLRR